MSTNAFVRYQLLVDIEVNIVVDERESIRTTKQAAIDASAEPVRKLLETLQREGVLTKARAVDVLLPSLGSSAEP